MLGNVFTQLGSRSWVLWTHRYSVPILVAALVISSLSAWIASRIRLDSNLVALLPDNAQPVRDMNQASEKAGGFGELMVMIESEDFDQSLRFARDLTPKIRALPWVGWVESGMDPAFFQARKMLYLSLDDLSAIHNRIDARLRYDKLKRNPMYVDLGGSAPPALEFADITAKYDDPLGLPAYYATPDGQILILVVRPNGVTSDLSFARRIHEDVNALVAAMDPLSYHPDMQVSLGGTFRNWIDEYETVVSDVRSSALWVGLGILLLLALYFGRPVAVLLIVLPLFMALTWTFAIAALSIGKLNLITVFLFVILFGLGIDFGIHMLTRYWAERSFGSDTITALTTAVQHTGRASLTAALTTASAFFVLTLVEFRGFSEFGFIAGMGLIMSAAAFLIVFPALVSIAERLGLMGDRRRGLTSIAAKPLRSPGLLLGASAIVTVGLAIWLPRLAFEYDLRELRSNVSSTREFTKKKHQVFENGRGAAVVLVKGKEAAAGVAETLRQRQRERGKESAIDRVWALSDLVPDSQQEKLAVIADIKALIDRNRDSVPEQYQTRVAALKKDLAVTAFGSKDLPEHIQRRFLGRPGTDGQMVAVFQKHGLLDLRRAVRFAGEIRDINVRGETYRPASESLVFAAMFEAVKRDAPIALFLCVIAVFGAVLLDVKRLSHTLIVLSPLGLGVLWMLGGMGALGIKLNLLNAVVLPSLLGIGVDAGVHFYHRYRESGPAQMLTVLRQTGLSVGACTATSMMGFGSLLLADHPGLKSIGALALLGIGSCLVAALVFFPALLVLVKPKRRAAPSVIPIEMSGRHLQGRPEQPSRSWHQTG
ncbi:MAG: MMPL family transporter [Myxococcota bacterium]|nr:MMPL family transporter [Myxococcota bacterium]